MSFLSGGAECSTGANPLSQFSKQVQDDKSLQRDRLVGRGPGGRQEGFRNSVREGGHPASEMMNDFMQQPSHMQTAPPMAMEQMHRQFEQMHTGPQQNASPNWAAEFDPGTVDAANMEAAFAKQNGGVFNRAEFERFQAARSHSPMNSTQQQMNGYRGSMGMPYGGSGMYAGSGMMGMGGMGMMNRPFGGIQSQPPQQEMQGKGKGRMVELDDQDWEAQFAELEQHKEEGLDEEATRAMEEELDAIDRSVHDPLAEYLKQDTDARLGNFEALWEKIQAETQNRNMQDEAAQWQESARTAMEDWENFSSTDLNTHLRDPEMGNYLFEDDNLFKDVANPFEEGCRIMDEGGNLSLAALAFEAAVQKDPQHVEAWTRLGAAQAQNEKETPAIRALEQAIKIDPQNLEALMGLAVSYTNEGYDSTAYRTLERWLSVKYPQITGHIDGFDPMDPMSHDIGFTDRQLLHDRVTDLYIRAAQLSPDPATMDPDVQVGLGVLFYGAEEFDKAVDCFSAALHSREEGVTTSEKSNQRALLWNRLGATLANSGRSEEAIEAYEKALEINPNFVRARYNLGVSCVNIGVYPEAAQHLLGALSMHSVVAKEAKEKAKELVGSGAGDGQQVADEDIERIIRQNQSTNLYDTLRRVFGQMGRKDLAEKVTTGVDPDVFRGEFEF